MPHTAGQVACLEVQHGILQGYHLSELHLCYINVISRRLSFVRVTLAGFTCMYGVHVCSDVYTGGFCRLLHPQHPAQQHPLHWYPLQQPQHQWQHSTTMVPTATSTITEIYSFMEHTATSQWTVSGFDSVDGWLTYLVTKFGISKTCHWVIIQRDIYMPWLRQARQQTQLESWGKSCIPAISCPA